MGTSNIRMAITIVMENKMKLIKGETLESQMRSVDKILDRFSRRLHKTVTGVITPFPISGYVSSPVGKVILRYMFPADGRITVGGAFIESIPKGGIDIYLNIHRVDGNIDSKSIFVKKQSIVIKPDMDVFCGDRLVISVDSKGGESVSGVWTSFLWVPTVRDSEIKKFLLDDLERTGEYNVEIS